MEQKIIKSKYEVIDTLYSDELQSIYICSITSGDSEEKFILGEFSDEDIKNIVKSSFLSGGSAPKSLLDSFEIDEKFYVLFPMVAGISLEEHLSKHSITLADKMLLTEELLKKFMEIEKFNPLIQYILSDLNNLSVINRKYLSFNNLFCFDKSKLDIDLSSVIKRLGHIICCIFANSPDGDIIRDRDALPPAISPIVSKALEGSYESAAKIYDDFKKTLLYTTFIGSASLDDQIRSKIKKAQKRYVIYWPRLIASLVLIAALLGGGFFLIKKAIPAIGSGRENPHAADKKNNAPIAEFSISINKIYAGDEVTFIDESSDPDPVDAIKSRLWTVERDGTVVLNSDGESLNYIFAEPGDYSVSLVVQDTRGAGSQPCNYKLKVLEKPELPQDSPGTSDNSEDMK